MTSGVKLSHFRRGICPNKRRTSDLSPRRQLPMQRDNRAIALNCNLPRRERALKSIFDTIDAARLCTIEF
jgi:hypothetical protein